MHIASHYVPHCLSIMPWPTTQYFSNIVSLHSFVMVPLYNFPCPLYPHLLLIALNPTPSIFGTYSSSLPALNKYSVVPTTPTPHPHPHPLSLSYLRTLNISSSPTAPLLACITALLICSIVRIANRSRHICLPSTQLKISLSPFTCMQTIAHLPLLFQPFKFLLLEIHHTIKLHIPFWCFTGHSPSP